MSQFSHGGGNVRYLQEWKEITSVNYYYIPAYLPLKYTTSVLK